MDVNHVTHILVSPKFYLLVYLLSIFCFSCEVVFVLGFSDVTILMTVQHPFLKHSFIDFVHFLLVYDVPHIFLLSFMNMLHF